MSYTLEHVRVAQMDIPGEMWDALTEPKHPIPAKLAEACMVLNPFDYLEPGYFIKTSIFLQALTHPRFPKRLRTLAPYVQEASDNNYDYLMCRFV